MRNAQDDIADQNTAKDAAYEAWATRKIEAALAHDKANPDKRMSQQDVWEKYGLVR